MHERTIDKAWHGLTPLDLPLPMMEWREETIRRGPCPRASGNIREYHPAAARSIEYLAVSDATVYKGCRSLDGSTSGDPILHPIQL